MTSSVYSCSNVGVKQSTLGFLFNTIQGKLYLLSLTFVVLLVAMIILSLVRSYDGLVRERKNQVKSEVQTAASLIHSYVSKAQSNLLTASQAQEAAKQAIASLRYGKDGYFFIIDMQPRMVMHPIKPSKDGKDLSGIKHYVDMVNQVQAHGDGFVSYLFPLPGTEKPVEKVTYVEGIPAWGWIVSSGLYMVNVKHAFYRQIAYFSALGIVILICALVVAAWLGRSIAKPIGEVTQRLSEISLGDADLTQRLDGSRRDEVGALATAFNQFVARIQQLISEVADSSKQLASAAEQLSVTSEETKRHVAHQQSEAEQVSTAMNEMSATVQDVASNAQEAAQNARNADKEARVGRDVVVATVEAIDTLAREVEAAATVIGEVEADSEQIGQVLEVIRGISEQTNLLALNAAIEAARAGEQGRGFAVVADEVRNLARRTQDSTEEIRSMIERLQTGARNAVQVMQSSKNMANDGVAKARDAGQSLGAITQAVAQISDMNALIAAAAEQQTAVADEINRNVNNIAVVSQQTAEGAQDTSDASQALARLASQLQALIGQFQV